MLKHFILMPNVLEKLVILTIDNEFKIIGKNVTYIK